jgi:putative heme iron utilization protein
MAMSRYCAYNRCIHTLADVIIINSTHADFVLRVVFSWGVFVTITTQAKVVSYYD